MEYTYETVKLTCDADIAEDEAKGYVEHYRDKFGEALESLDIAIDGEYADVTYHLREAQPFERIRRITGYLVGTLDRFNDGKRAEEAERVKHSLERHDYAVQNMER